MDATNIRITAASLPLLRPSLVRILGKVTLDAANHTAVIATSTNPAEGVISLQTAQNLDMAESGNYEIVGMTNEDGTVRVLSAVALGEEFDLGAAEKLVSLIAKAPELFQ